MGFHRSLPNPRPECGLSLHLRPQTETQRNNCLKVTMKQQCERTLVTNFDVETGCRGGLNQRVTSLKRTLIMDLFFQKVKGTTF